MTIKQLSIEDLLDTENQDLFSSRKWLEVYPKNYLKIYGIYNEKEVLIGHFNTTIEVKNSFIKILRAPQFSQHNGLYIHSNHNNNAVKSTFNKKVLEAISVFLNNQKNVVISITFPINITDYQPFSWKGFKVNPNYTYRINLKNDISAIESNINPKTRNSIKKAIKDGITHELTYNYEAIFKLVENTFDRKSVNVDNEILRNILFKYANETNSFSYIAYQNGHPIAGTFVVYDKNTAYYLLGGYDKEKSHSGAGPLIVKESILKSKELGLSIFDFEGSSIPAIESYFRSFGGELTTLHAVSKASFIKECVLKLKKRSVF